LIEREILYQDAMSRLSKGPAAKLLEKIKDMPTGSSTRKCGP